MGQEPYGLRNDRAHTRCTLQMSWTYRHRLPCLQRVVARSVCVSPSQRFTYKKYEPSYDVMCTSLGSVGVSFCHDEFQQFHFLNSCCCCLYSCTYLRMGIPMCVYSTYLRMGIPRLQAAWEGPDCSYNFLAFFTLPSIGWFSAPVLSLYMLVLRWI